jgi:DNA-binding MarR family transcriptional regulator
MAGSPPAHPKHQQKTDDAKYLLAQAGVIYSACDLDLLVFLHRHPRTLLTSEQLAALAGYTMNEVAKSLDVFIEAGLLERIQSPTHAARMLVLNGPAGGELQALLKLASTRQGRRNLLEILQGGRAHTEPGAQQQLRLARSA